MTPDTWTYGGCVSEQSDECDEGRKRDEKALLKLICDDATLLSLLYDANLLPEQTTGTKEYARTMLIAYYWRLRFPLDQDAKRYRWLRTAKWPGPTIAQKTPSDFFGGDDDKYPVMFLRSDIADRTIDAAIAAEENK